MAVFAAKLMQAGAPACSSLRSTQRKSEVEPSGGAKKQREPHSRQLGWRPARREREEEGVMAASARSPMPNVDIPQPCSSSVG